MWYVSDVLYVCVDCFVMCGFAVSRRCINVCNNDVFSVVNMYIDHLKFCIVWINGRRYVCYRECYVAPSVMSPLPDLCNQSVRTVVKFYLLWEFLL